MVRSVIAISTAIKGRVQGGQQMNEPTEKKNPENPGQAKTEQCGEEPSLDQLPETGNEEAANRRDDIAR
jgi:hypothetical protein